MVNGGCALISEQNILDFLCELADFNNIRYTKHVLLLLEKYLGITNSFFLAKQSLSGDWERVNAFNGFHAIKNMTLVYNEMASSMDFMSPANLPPDYRQRNVIQDCELPAAYKVRIEYSAYIAFFQSHGYEYFASINLLNAEGVCIGRIFIANEKGQGEFGKDQIDTLNKLARHISSAYAHVLEYKIVKYRLELFVKNNTLLPIGIISLDNKFGVYEANKASYLYSIEILSFLEKHIPSKKGYHVQTQLIGLILENYTLAAGSTKIEISCGENTFILSIFPCMLTSQGSGVEINYFIHISKCVNSEALAYDRLVEKYNLTSREISIISLIDKGLNNQEISNQLYISSHTVKSHITNIYRKVDVTNRTALLHKIRM